MQVEIREKYELSGQYYAQRNVMAEYLDSFLAELDTRSVVERNMLAECEMYLLKKEIFFACS